MTSSSIAPAIVIKVWNTERTLTFSNTRDALSWVDAELATWGDVKHPTQSRLVKMFNQQRAGFVIIKTAAEGADTNALRQSLSSVETGTLLTSDSLYFPVIKAIGSIDGDAAAFAMLTARSDSQTQLQSMGLNPPLDLLARFGVLTGMHAGIVGEVTLEVDTADLRRLKSAYDSSLSEGRNLQSDLEGTIKASAASFGDSQSEREVAWKEELARVQGEWAKLKNVYDTELGLRAPTTYWTERAVSHRNQSIGYGIAFAIALTALILVFSGKGLSYLISVPTDRSAILAIMPIIIPAFAGIWVLRIVGRLLSESLLLMRDAKERETLVKTFLALMKDDVAGKSVVKDEDRILILHSLFRPSSITAADDAPPVHWFDLLATKLGNKK